MTIVWFLLGLSILIFIHELGHFITAKIFNVYCYEFSLFMGPLLYQKKVGETKYSIRALPIGGYVSMAGDRDAQEKENLEKDVVDVPAERTINGIAHWKRFIVISAGAIMNLVLCFLLLLVAYLGEGVADVSSKVRVVEGSIFAQAGVENGDQIVRIKRSTDPIYVEVDTFSEVNTYLTNANLDAGLEVGSQQCFEIVFVRGGEELSPKLICRTLTEYTTEVNEETQERVVTNIKPILGFSQTSRSVGFVEALGFAYRAEVGMGSMIFNAVGTLFTKEGFQNVSGPIGMYQAAETFASQGIYSFMFYLAMISVNLGIINLLPFPALDGGRLIVILVEWISRKRVPPKVEGWINSLGFLFLIGLLVAITIKDIFFV